MPALYFLPERAADRAGIGATVEDGANDVDLARAGIAVLADVAVEAQRAVVALPNEAFAFQKVNRQDRSMAAVAAAERQRAVPQIGERGDRPAAHRDDLGRPADIRIAHGNRPASVVAPRIGLQIREVGVPTDVDVRRMI